MHDKRELEGIKGALAIQHIKQLIELGCIFEAQDENLQPSSMDLSLSGEIYRMKGSFLPRKNESIRDLLKDGILFPVSLNQPLELNGIYYVRLNESLNLPSNVYGYTNNKSSSGRVNLQTRLLVNGTPSFDYIPRGYQGELWLEIIPKSFPVLLGYGERLNQLRFFTSDSRLNEEQYRKEHENHGFLRDNAGNPIAIPDNMPVRGITMTIDLSSSEIIGYKCTPTTARVLNYSGRDHNALDFFEPIYRPKNGQLTMKRDEFYIFVTKEGIRVPREFAVEMQAYDVSMGEFRSHYAGFFDPGFGFGGNGETKGSPAVLEIFTHDQDFILRDGQPICTMLYEYLSAPAEVYYGAPELSSNYYCQSGPRLSKHFKQDSLPRSASAPSNYSVDVPTQAPAAPVYPAQPAAPQNQTPQVQP